MEAALDRSLPKTLGPLFGSKKNFNPPDIPGFDEMTRREKSNEYRSPFSRTKYDTAHEQDQFVDYPWWKDKNKGILTEQQKSAGTLTIGGAKALDHQKHLQILGENISREDVDGLDQS